MGCKLCFEEEWLTFQWLSSVKISVWAMSTLFQATANSSCLCQLSLPTVSWLLEAMRRW